MVLARRCRFRLVDDVLQLLAGLEERNLLGRDFDAVAGLRIPPDSGFALSRAETAEAADLDLVARPQRSNYTVENRFDDDLGVLPGHFCQSRYLFDQVGFRHSGSRPRMPNTISDSISCWQVRSLTPTGISGPVSPTAGSPRGWASFSYPRVLLLPMNADIPVQGSVFQMKRPCHRIALNRKPPVARGIAE